MRLDLLQRKVFDEWVIERHLGLYLYTQLREVAVWIYFDLELGLNPFSPLMMSSNVLLTNFFLFLIKKKTLVFLSEEFFLYIFFLLRQTIFWNYPMQTSDLFQISRSLCYTSCFFLLTLPLNPWVYFFYRLLEYPNSLKCMSLVQEKSLNTYFMKLEVTTY